MSKIQNIDVRFNATGNFGQVQNQIKALETQAAGLAKVLQSSAFASTPAGLDPVKWRASTTAVEQASRIYRDAASSSGLLQMQQIRATSETDKMTRALQRQKVGVGEMVKNWGIMKQVYRDQLRGQKMTIQNWGTDSSGKSIIDVSIPKNVPGELDTVRSKIGMISIAAKSASTNIINMGKNVQWSGRQLTVGFSYPLAMIGAAAGVMSYKVEDAFASINKVYDVSAGALNNEALRAKEINQLRVDSMETATVAAERYGRTIETTLKVEQELAATGLNGSRLQDSTREVQRISALGDIDSGQTTEMVVALQNSFREELGTDTKKLTDTLNFFNATANGTSLSLQDIAEATPRAASGLAALGVTTKQMAVLLVSMKENGIQAEEGANALKSATTRILNPVAKATKFYDQFGISIQNISKESGGNLFEFIQRLGKEQEKIQGGSEKETKRLRASGIAALFGTYQYNRLFASVMNVNSAQELGNNQTAKALELMEMTPEALEKMAKASEKAMMDNPAGRFKAAWAKMQIELQEVGKPFLEAASNILGVVSKALDSFNDLNPGFKSFVMHLAAAVALAGPLVMMVGLFLQLSGWVTKAIAGVAGFAGKMRLMTTEQRAAALSTEAQNAAMKKTVLSSQTQTQEMASLAEAYRQATQSVREYTAATARAAAKASGRKAPVIDPNRPSGAIRFEEIDKAKAKKMGVSTKRGGGRTRLDVEKDYAHVQALEVQKARAIEEQNIKLSQQEKTMGRIRGAAQGLGSAMLMATFAYGTMNDEHNEFIQKASKWLLIGTVVVPVFTQLGRITKAIAASAILEAKARRESAIAAAATSSGVRGAGAKGMAKGIGGGLMAAAGGPAGIAIAGIVGLVSLQAWAKKKGEEGQKEAERLAKKQLRVQQELNESTKVWVETLGKAPGEYQKIYQGTVDLQNNDPTKQRELTDLYNKPQGNAKQSFVENVRELPELERRNAIIKKFIDLQVEGKLTADEAVQHATIMYQGLGKGLIQASASAKALKSEFDISEKNFDWGAIFEDSMTQFNSATETELPTAGRNAAQLFNQAFVAAAQKKGPEGDAAAKAILSNFTDPLANEVGGLYDKLLNDYAYNGIEKFFKTQGVTDAQTFSKWMNENSLKDIRGMDGFKSGEFSVPLGSVIMDLDDAKAKQDALLAGLREIMGLGKGELNGIFEVPDLIGIQAGTMSYKEQKEIVNDINGLVSSTNVGINEESRALQTAKINAFNAANGFKQSSDYSEALAYFLNKVKADAGGAADEAARLAGNIDGIPNRVDVEITEAQGVGIVKEAMAATQSRMVTSAGEKFENDWSSRMDGVKNSHQAATDAMERANENASKAFEDRWERRKKAVEEEFDVRKKKIDDAIEAEQRAEEIRKRLFEAERRRLEQWQDQQNRNIDMAQAITEGRVDDAAKLAVDGQVASENNNMDNEEASASNKADDRIGRLEDKSDALDKKREAALEKLEKTEERMRAHMERAQQARSAALTKQQNAQIASLDNQKAYEKASLDQRLNLFKSYTGKNQKDLEAWMKTVGLTYDHFGSDVMAKGDSWSSHFKVALRDEILLAGTQVASNNMWEGIGASMVGKLVKGMGFKNWNDFTKFVNTGKLTTTPGAPRDTTKRSHNRTPDDGPAEINHGGGVVGAGGSGRGRIPNNYKGLHPSEQMVLAQKGEYMINAKAAQDPNNRQIIEAINSGQPLPAFGGVGNIAVGAMGAMVKTGIGHAAKRGITKGNNAAKAAQADTGGPGKVGGGGFKKPTGVWNSPWNGHYSTNNGHDYGLADKPLYAPRNGTLTTHATYTGSKGPKNGGFGSYGQHVKFYGGGASMMFAHLSKLPFGAGGSKKVKAGQYIGTTGETGNAWGKHVHVELPTNSGNSHNFGNFFRQAGVSLRTGGTVKYDETPAMLHKDETVLTASLTKRFQDNVASGGGDKYDITIDLRGAMVKENVDIEKAVNTAIDRRQNKRGRQRVVR